MNDLAILDASTPAVISAETRDDLKRTSKSNLARVARLRGGRRDLEPVFAKVSGIRNGPVSARAGSRLTPLSASLCRGSA